MQIYDEKHVDSGKADKKAFSLLKGGDICIHQSRVLMKLSFPLYRLVADSNGDKTPVLERVTAIRLGHIYDMAEGEKIAGKSSTIGDDTVVEVIDRDIAGLYLKG